MVSELLMPLSFYEVHRSAVELLDLNNCSCSGLLDDMYRYGNGNRGHMTVT